MKPQHPQTVDQLLQRMVHFNTINTASSGNPQAEADLVDYLESVAQHMGLKTRRLPVTDPQGRDRGSNLLVTSPPKPGKPWLMFESHMDTVSVDGMTIDPFAGEIRDGKLYGRGSCDTKGTGAAALWALSQYVTLADQPNNIALLHTVDEEFGMTGIRALVKDHWSTLGFEPVGVIVGEPTRLRPVTAHNGGIRFRLTTHGVACHSSMPEKGQNAISMMAHVIRALEDHYIAPLTASHPLTGKAACSVTIIHGGSQINIIPESCSIDVDRRLVPGESPDDVLPAVAAVLDQLRDRQPTVNVQFDSSIGSCPPLTPQSNSSFLPIVTKALRSLDLPVEPDGAPYATNAGDLAAAGIPAIVIGPGTGAAAHTKDEFVQLSEIHQGVKLYLAMMQGSLT